MLTAYLMRAMREVAFCEKLGEFSEAGESRKGKPRKDPGLFGMQTLHKKAMKQQSSRRKKKRLRSKRSPKSPRSLVRHDSGDVELTMIVFIA